MNRSVVAVVQDARWRRWLGLWTLAIAPAVLLAVVVLPVLVVTVVAVLAFAATFARLVACDDGQRRPGVTPAGRRWIVRVATQVAVLVVGLMGALSYSVWLGLAAIGVFALHSCVGAASRTSSAARPASVPEQRTASAAPPVRSSAPASTSANHLAILSDSELCREWRQSFVVLRGATGSSRRAWVVNMRQSLLEELERRNPEGLESWLRAGGGAAGGPDRYFR